MSSQQRGTDGPAEIGVWHGPPPAWRAGDRPRLVVLPFAAYDYDGYQAVYARRLAEWLATRLHATDAVEAAFPVLVGATHGAPDYAMLTRLPEPEQVGALCRPAGARWGVFGRLNLTERLELEVFVLDAHSGTLVFGEQAEYEAERALEAMTVVALQVLRALGVPALDDDARSRLFEHGTRSLDAVRNYLLAADLLGHPARTTADVSNGLNYAFAALDQDPGFHPPADLVIGELLRQLDGDAEQAQSGLLLLHRLTEFAPDYHKAPAAVGMVWQRGGDHEQAARAYREALRLSPGHPYYLFRLGLSLDALDDPEALPTLTAAVEADPANLAAGDLLGARLANLGRLDEAMDLWGEQLARRPTHAPALTNLGVAYEARGDLAQARQAYEAALQANPSYAPALDRAADLLARLGELTPAAELLERLTALHADDPAVLDRLARVLAQLNRPEQELATLGRLLRLRPDHWPAHYAVAVRQQRLGRRDEAIAAYYRVLEHQPDHVPSLIDLGVLLGGKRQLSEAARLLGRAYALAPEEPNAAYNFAVIQMERGEWAQADALLHQVKRLAPDDPLPDRVARELNRRRQRGY